MRSFLFFIITVGMALIFTAEFARAQNNFGGEKPPKMAALIIGVSEYKYADNLKLNFANRDAIQFAKLLNCARNVDIEKVILLPDEKATHKNVNKSLDQLRVMASDTSSSFDYLLIFFSGHGVLAPPELDSKGSFVLYNSIIQEADIRGFDHSDLVCFLKTSFSKCSRIFIIADACHSGRLTGAELSANLPILPEQHNFAGKQKRVVEMLSSEAGQTSKELNQLEHGLFTYYLIRGLEGEAYANSTGENTLHDLYLYLKKNLEPEGQTPVYTGTGSFIDFDNTCLDYAKKNVEKFEGKITGQKSVKSVPGTTLPLKTLFDTLLVQKRINAASDTSAYWVLQEAKSRTEYSGVYEEMRSSYIAAVIDENIEIVNRYLTQDIYPWVTKFSDIEAGLLMHHSMLELLRPEELLYRKSAARYFFYQAFAWYEYAKFANGRDKTRMLQNASQLIGKSIISKPGLPSAYFLQSQISLGLEPEKASDTWTAKMLEIQKLAPNWRLPHLYTRERSSLAEYGKMLEKYRMNGTVSGTKLTLLDSLIRLDRKMTSAKEISSLFSENPILGEDLFLTYSLLANNYDNSAARHQTMLKNSLGALKSGSLVIADPDKTPLFLKLKGLSESNALAEKLVEEEMRLEQYLDSKMLFDTIAASSPPARQDAGSLVTNNPLLSKKIYAAIAEGTIQNLAIGKVINSGTTTLGLKQHNARGYLELKFTALSSVQANFSDTSDLGLFISNPFYTKSGLLDAMSFRYFEKSITARGRLANNVRHLLRVTPRSNPESKLLEEVNVPLRFIDRMGYYIDFNTSNLSSTGTLVPSLKCYSLSPNIFVSYMPRIAKSYADVIFGAGPWLRVTDDKVRVNTVLGWQINSRFSFSKFNISFNYANDFGEYLSEGRFFITAGCNLQFPFNKREYEQKLPDPK